MSPMRGINTYIRQTATAFLGTGTWTGGAQLQGAIPLHFTLVKWRQRRIVSKKQKDVFFSSVTWIYPTKYGLT